MKKDSNCSPTACGWCRHNCVFFSSLWFAAGNVGMLLALEDLVMEMRISWQINEEVNKEFSSGRFCIQEVSLMFCGSSCVSERLYCTLLRLHSVQTFFSCRYVQRVDFMCQVP